MESEKLKIHHSEPVNSSMSNKEFKLITYQEGKGEISTEPYKVNNPEDFNRLLEKVNQYNHDPENEEKGRYQKIII